MQSVPRKGGRRFEGSFMGGNGLKGGRMKGSWGGEFWGGEESGGSLYSFYLSDTYSSKTQADKKHTSINRLRDPPISAINEITGFGGPERHVVCKVLI